MRKSETIKERFDKHKEGIKKEAVRCFWFALGLGVGYFISDKISDYQVGAGLDRLAREGIIKFFEPSTGLEVGIEKAVEIADKLNKK